MGNAYVDIYSWMCICVCAQPHVNVAESSKTAGLLIDVAQCVTAEKNPHS